MNLDISVRIHNDFISFLYHFFGFKLGIGALVEKMLSLLTKFLNLIELVLNYIAVSIGGKFRWSFCNGTFHCSTMELNFIENCIR